MNGSVVVTAASGPLGRRVCALVAGDPDVERIVAVDRPDRAGRLRPDLARLSEDSGIPIEMHGVHLTDPDLKRHIEGVTVILHLDTGEVASPANDVPDEARAVDGTRALLDLATALGVRTVVVLSSAMTYGAWPNNPVPLTEAAPLRPVPELAGAVEQCEIERLAGQWRDEQAAGDMAATVALLRAAPTVGPQQTDLSSWPPARLRVGESEPPMQFLHLDDLASAVDVARRQRLDGPYNVAPDGWLTATQIRALRGPAARLALPAPIIERLAAVRSAIGLTGVRPAVLPYIMHPWVIANDRLKAAGWQPRHANDEAFVEAAPAHPLTEMPPGRRQALSLAVLGGVAAGAVVAAAVAIRAWHRRRR